MLCPVMTQRTLFAAASYSSSEACCFTRAWKETSMVCTVLADSMPPGLTLQKDAICEGDACSATRHTIQVTMLSLLAPLK